MRLVLALGGNALLRRGEGAQADTQQRNVRTAVSEIAELAQDHQVIVTHGNGPQVGLLALQAEAYPEVTPYPLDLLGAESEGLIGYLLEQGLASELPGRRVAALLTQVQVDPADPAFRQPTKPIGPVYDQPSARAIAAQRGWRVALDGAGFRRVVPSPRPLRILEIETIRLLVDANVLVVCAGGGGIPVVIDDSGAITGVEAVVDKDHSAALLAAELNADALLLLTDVDAIWAGWGTPVATAIAGIHPRSLLGLDLPEGSMGPKAEAACHFATTTGRPAYIGALGTASRVLGGCSGTRVSTDEDNLRWSRGDVVVSRR